MIDGIPCPLCGNGRLHAPPSLKALEETAMKYYVIPRAQLKAYRAAAKEWMEDHTNCGEKARCECDQCMPANKLWDALRAAGIEEESGK